MRILFFSEAGKVRKGRWGWERKAGKVRKGRWGWKRKAGKVRKGRWGWKRKAGKVRKGRWGWKRKAGKVRARVYDQLAFRFWGLRPDYESNIPRYWDFPCGLEAGTRNSACVEEIANTNTLEPLYNKSQGTSYIYSLFAIFVIAIYYFFFKKKK